MRKSAWDTIANYEAHEIVRKRYEEKHGREPNAAHVREITASFVQARHYYASAATADRTVKPLLLYYGVVSLSRGLVLFLTWKLRAAALAQGHGLSVLDWQSVLGADRPDLGELKIKVNDKGSFCELLDATGNRSLLRAGNSAVNRKSDEGPVSAGTELTLVELLATLPEVIDQFKHWKVPRCVPFSFRRSAESQAGVITVPRWLGTYIDGDLVANIIGPDNCETVSMDKENIVVLVKAGASVSFILTDLIDERLAGTGDLYFAPRYASGVGLGKIAQLFAISYILSMLVRYYPSTWMALLYQQIGDAAAPTISKVTDCIETLYPRIVVDFLEEQ